MTIDDALDAYEKAKAKAYASARKLCPGITHMAKPLVNEARLVVIETTLAGLMAERTTYLGNSNDVVMALEMRDYWEEVAKEVAK